MNLHLLITLIIGNLFLCGLILFNWQRENYHNNQLAQKHTESSFPKIKLIETKKTKLNSLSNTKNLSSKTASQLAKNINENKIKTSASKVKTDSEPIIKPKIDKINIKRKNEPQNEDKKLQLAENKNIENKNEADLKGQINQAFNNSEKLSAAEKLIKKSQNIESSKAIEDLTNQYYVTLDLSKKETKALLNSLLKPTGKNPCLAWQIKGLTLEKCKAKSILEAGIYAINAKLIPCKSQITDKDYKTYIACYKDRKKII